MVGKIMFRYAERVKYGNIRIVVNFNNEYFLLLISN